MARADRASQFVPFAALKGFEEALRKREVIKVDKAELSEDALEDLDFKLSQISCGEIITVVYYEDNEYIKKTGMVAKINRYARYITIVKTDISFDSIKEIKV